MADMRRHRLALSIAAWLVAAVHPRAQSPADDHWFFGSIEWCDSGATHVRTHASELDFLVHAGNDRGDFPEAFVFSLLKGSHDDESQHHVAERSLLFLQYLNAGFRLAPIATQECSADKRGGYEATRRTVVLARAHTERAIADAFTQRRAYASSDTNVKILFSINGYPFGSVAPMAAGTPLRIEVRLADPDEPLATYWVSLRHDDVGGPLEAQREISGTGLNGDGTVVFTQFRRGGSDEYYLLEITQGRGAQQDVVWTAPIWLVSDREAPMH